METVTDDNTSSLITDLISSLEQATLMAKQLQQQTTTNPSQKNQIHSTLHSAHYSLSRYLHHSALNTPPPLRPSLMNDDEDDYMDEEIEKVEERIREVFIQNKRPKRGLSPETVAVIEEEEVKRRGESELDPVGTKVRSLDLVYQFHG